MRIIAGEFRGRRLKLPRARIRPTADRVKEAWFSILGAEVAGAMVADMFAGTGSLGLEALSRGARRVDFYENSRTVQATLERNIELLNVSDRVAMHRENALRAALSLREGYYDVVLADPPYGKGYAEKLLQVFLEHRFARRLCIEHSVGELTGGDVRRRYGDTEISFFTADV
ncbi:MAG: 16S rRNA (guanine(966)-N(2))-methyltransferase RsmD [Gemmatimonadales bacterium]